jgi:putative transposase
MPRRPRSDLAGFPLHLIQRGNNRSACFFTDADRAEYVLWLGRYASRFAVAIHAWVLMGNHVHLLVTPPSPAHASHLMQALGRRYVRYVNESHDRSGTLWEGRFRACAVHSEDYLLVCMRYIELNPVRAGIARSAAEYPWSSYRGNALGRADPLLTEHPLYTGLGASPAERLIAYRQLFAGHIREAELADIRAATISGHLLASEESRKKLETERGRLLGPAPIGRPKAAEDSRSHEVELLPFFR